MSLLREWPFAYVVSDHLISRVCHYCLKKAEDNLQRCSKCKFARFCNRQCQSAARKDHQEECVRLFNVYPKVPSETTRLVVRILFKLKGESSSGKDLTPVSRRFSDLMSHKDKISTDPIKSEHFTALCCVLKEYVGNLTAAEVMDVYAKIMVNCFSITDEDLNPVGTGLYLQLSALDHSCKPDCAVVFDGPLAILNSLSTKRNDGHQMDQLKISYIDLMSTTFERRTQLHAQYHFKCDCVRCENVEWDRMKLSVQCTTPLCNQIAVVDDTETHLKAICQKCGCCSHDESDLEEALRLMDMIKWRTEQLQSYFQSCDYGSMYEQSKGFLKRVKESILHPCNIRRVQVLDKLFDACLQLEKFEEACDYVSQSLQAYELFYPKNYPNVGIQYLKYGKLLLYLQKLDDAMVALEKAESYLTVSHGNDHSLYKTCNMLLRQCREEKVMLNSRGRIEEYFSCK